MSSFDVNTYLQNRAEADDKLQRLANASKQKVAELSQAKLEKSQELVANSVLYRSPGELLQDVGVTALKGAVGLPQSIAGVADIRTGGRGGKA